MPPKLESGEQVFTLSQNSSSNSINLEEVSTLVDGTGSGAQLHSPSGIAFNIFDGSLYVCDYGNDKIRKITTSGLNGILLFILKY